MRLWVVYEDDGLPAGTFDSKKEVAEFLGMSVRQVDYRLKKNDSKIVQINDLDFEDEEDY